MIDDDKEEQILRRYREFISGLSPENQTSLASVLRILSELIDPLPEGGKQEELLGGAQRAKPGGRENTEKAQGLKSAGALVWEEYERSYAQRYRGQRPPRNVLVNTQAKRLVTLVGLEDALKLASYYLEQRDEYYLRMMHPFPSLVADHHKLLMRMRTGQTVSGTQARQAEAVQATSSASQEYLRRKYGQKTKA